MSDIVSTTRYVTTTADLTGGAYAVDELAYIDNTTLLVTNNVANQVADIGSIGEIIEAPDLGIGGQRMVIQLTLSLDAFESPLKDLLRALDL